MNIAIVEDFITDIKRILGFFKQYDNSLISNLNVYKSGEDFLESANLYTLDVVFLDIYMEKLNGMDVAEKIRKVNETCQIIFVTTSADFAVKSYEVRAFDYLLKPVTFEKFSKVMKNLEKNMKRIAQSIVVKTGRTNRKLFVSDIVYVDYYNHYIQIHTKDEKILVYSKFSEFEKRLSIYLEFLTCYRCVMINMNKVEKIDESFFLMQNGDFVPINRANSGVIKESYTNYIISEMESDHYYDK